MAKNSPDFGQVFQDLLLSKGFTDGMLADCLKKDRSTVYRWHSEGRAPDTATLKLVAECLKLSHEEKLQLYEAAGYVVVVGPPGPDKEELPPQVDSPPEPKPVVQAPKDPLLLVREPPIVPFPLAEQLVPAKKQPESDHKWIQGDLGAAVFFFLLVLAVLLVWGLLIREVFHLF